jgi:acylpyruvate hydrolase
MRLATVADRTGATTAALLDGDGNSDGEQWRSLPAADLSELFRTADIDQFAALAGAVIPQATPVLPLPTPGKVICCGLNYADHIRETGRDLPAYPTLFAKYADTLVGPADDVVLPTGLDVDWEAELAVVLGKRIRDASTDEARAAIAGHTVANDISVRDWQYRTLQWFQGKAWDRSTPIGPVLVDLDEADPADGLEITCRVNGEQVQRASTSTLVFDSAALLAYISAFTVLRPGDIVLTGTSGGVGSARDPKRFLADGQSVETEIDGIGLLRNRIRFVNR